MAMRLGAPRFMLHDLRKLVATVGEKLGLGDAVLRRILNHTAPKTDVLHRHYVGLNDGDVVVGLVLISKSPPSWASKPHSLELVNGTGRRAFAPAGSLQV
jgi:hypothetical protein